MQNTNSTKAHIYIFVEKNKKNKPLTEKIFYVGSSIHVSQRVEQHIKAFITTQQNNIDREVYLYMANTVGIHNFDVYILDNRVPAELLKTYERLYYDALISGHGNLQNTYKPVPENLEFTKQQSNISLAQHVVNQFHAKFNIGGNQMSQEEMMINDMKKYCVLYFVGKNNSPDQPEITRVKQQVKELKQENNSLRDTNELLLSENKLLKDFNECLKKHEERGYFVANKREHYEHHTREVEVIMKENEQLSKELQEAQKEICKIKQRYLHIQSENDISQSVPNVSNMNNKDKHKNTNKLLREQGRKKCHMCDNIYSLTNISKHYKICPGYSIDQLMKKIEQLESQNKAMV